MRTSKKQQRRYYLHYRLRKAGYTILTIKKTVLINSTEFEKRTTAPLNMKYIAELIELGYGIQSTIA